MNANYEIPTCTSQQRWFECSVARKDARGVNARQAKAQGIGQKLAAKLKVGDWVAIQDRLSQDVTIPFITGQTLEAVAGSNSCIQLQVKRSNKGGSRITINGTRFDPGDAAIAVQW